MRTYRAWTDNFGGKEERRQPDSLRLVDWETNEYRIWLRWIWRWKPFYFAIIPFCRSGRGVTILRLGRRTAGDRLQLHYGLSWLERCWYWVSYHLTNWRYG